MADRTPAPPADQADTPQRVNLEMSPQDFCELRDDVEAAWLAVASLTAVLETYDPADRPRPAPLRGLAVLLQATELKLESASHQLQCLSAVTHGV